MGSICCTKGLPLSVDGSSYKSHNSQATQKVKILRNYNSVDSVYRIEAKKLGFGSYGDVKLCYDLNFQIPKAVKIINKDYLRTANIHSDWFYTKIDLLNKLDHPLIISFIEFFEERDFYYLLMDYHEEGDLLKRLKTKGKFSEISVALVIHQILIAIAYMHKRKIAHRDVKLENILISTKNGISVKLIDFDTAASFKDKQLAGKHGTFHYMAPEIITRQYSEKCDIWSCGIILYVLLTGKKNLPGLSDKQEPSKVQKIKFDFNSPVYSKLPSSAVDLLKSMLKINPDDRVSAEDALKNPWFSSVKLSSYDSCLEILERIRNETSSAMIRSAKKFVLSTKKSEDLNDVEKVFLYLDSDFDGLLRDEDFYNFYSMKHSKTEAAEAVNEIMAKLGGMEFVCFSDFTEVAVDIRRFVERENLKNFFEFLCGGADGKLVVEGLAERLSLVKVWDKEDIDSWVSCFVDDGRGVLEFEDFLEMVFKEIG